MLRKVWHLGVLGEATWQVYSPRTPFLSANFCHGALVGLFSADDYFTDKKGDYLFDDSKIEEAHKQ
jgi:hypothetical protein